MLTWIAKALMCHIGGKGCAEEALKALKSLSFRSQASLRLIWSKTGFRDNGNYKEAFPSP